MTAVHGVVMGVSGCGKSEIGQRIAEGLRLPLIEGDAFHPPANIEKMQRGIALGDDDRAGWLDELGRQLRAHPQGAVLTCSALKRSYRDRLRAAQPGLLFIHLALPQDEALKRVAARPGHFYPPSLVASQFEALEDPRGEPGVLQVDARHAPEEIARTAGDWLRDARRGNSTMRN
jgi:gluconokinase